jgi:predicted Zn finger-like uncharacterized protein
VTQAIFVADAMLIVCPSCATSYQIDATSVGAQGRMVRCARCRATWFASAPRPEDTVDAFVDGIIAEAEAEQPPPKPPAPRAPLRAMADDDDFGREAEPAPEPFQHVDAAAQAVVAAAAEPPPVLDDSPSLVPPIDHMPIPEPAARPEPDPAESESFIARRRKLQSKRQKSRRTSRWTAVVLVLLAFNVAVIGARNEVVRYLPQTASLFAAIGLPVNLRQLDFEDVRISREADKGVTVLLVDGKIVSKAKKPLEVPRLRFAARNASGQEVYTWTARPERSILPPGESMEFHTSLAKPPADATDVMVRFFTASDAMAGGK